jgi:hypothetical protein
MYPYKRLDRKNNKKFHKSGGFNNLDERKAIMV